MNKNQAIEKINKLLRLANDKGASEGEKKNAIAMAEKIAAKHGLRIEKKENKEIDPFAEFIKRHANDNKIYTEIIHVGTYNKDLLNMLFSFIPGLKGIVHDGEKNLSIRSEYEFDGDKFVKFYKKVCKLYNRLYREQKESKFYFDGKDFKRYFIATFRGANINGFEEVHSISKEFSEMNFRK